MKVIKTDVPDMVAGREINLLLEQYINEEVFLLLSGGSAFRILSHIDLDLLSDRVTIGVLDERCGEGNNFKKLSQTEFYTKALSKGINVIDTSVDLSKEELKEMWESKLTELLSKDVKVIATLGMGIDGHTSGIFPGYDMPDTLLHSYTVKENEYPERITTTPSFLKKIDYAVAFISGEEKREVLEDENSLAIQLWNYVRDVKVVTDIV